jgi:hypothetical protein
MATYQRKRRISTGVSVQSNNSNGMLVLKGLLWASIAGVSMFIIGFSGETLGLFK